MQVFIACPDLDFETISFTASSNSVSVDVLRAVAEEWDVDQEELELSFAGEVLHDMTRLVSNAVGPEDQLIASKKRFRLYGKPWFTDHVKAEQMVNRYSSSLDEYLYIDTSTFCSEGCVDFSCDLLQIPIKAISLRNFNENIVTVGDNFIRECNTLEKLDLSSRCVITEIGSAFLYDCTSFTTLNLSGMSTVTNIGSNFLGCCTSLKHLDLSGLCGVTSVNGSFASSCSSLETIDLSSFSNVTTVGSNFLFQCESIKEIDFSCFYNLKSIRDNFLCCCTSISSLNLSTLTKLTSVGSNFLSRCSSMSVLNLSGFNCLTKVDHDFLDHCNSLTELDLRCFNSVTKITVVDFFGRDRPFLGGLTALRSLQLPESNVIVREIIGTNLRSIVID